jgi:coiled-coil domain-containing protein 6
LREEKISLERLHEEESEAHVNRLARELAALRTLHQHCQTTQANTSGSALEDGEPVAGSTSGAQADTNAAAVSPSVLDPSTSVLLNALKKENETLRNRLATTERDYVRVTRLNEIYREELIQHRRRVSVHAL